MEPGLWNLSKVSCLQELAGCPVLTACRGHGSSLDCAVGVTEGLQCKCSVHIEETRLCVFRVPHLYVITGGFVDWISALSEFL